MNRVFRLTTAFAILAVLAAIAGGARAQNDLRRSTIAITYGSSSRNGFMPNWRMTVNVCTRPRPEHSSHSGSLPHAVHSARGYH